MNTPISSTPKISIICPVYNAEFCIRETLDSLLKQTFHDFEILCVDDGSQDSSVAILNEYAARDSRIRIFQKKNGKTAARCVSYAIPFCRGNYYFFVSHDDFFSPDLLEKMYSRAIETDADSIVCDVVMYHEGIPAEKQKVLRPPNGDYTLILSGEEAFRLSVDGWKIPASGLRKLDSFRRSGVYDHWFNSDEFSGWKHFLHSNCVVFGGGYYYYRQTPEAITKKTSPLLFETLCTSSETLEMIEKMEQKKWRPFLKKRMKAQISELRTARKRLKNQCGSFSKEDHERSRSIIQNTTSELLKMILRIHDFPLFLRFLWKLKIS